MPVSTPSGRATPGIGSLNFGVTAPPDTFARPLPPEVAFYAYALTADTGALAVTGTAASFSVSTVLGADAGSVAVAGTDAALERTVILPADSGAVVLTGGDAGLILQTAGHYAVSAAAGAVAISGTAASLASARALSANSGSLAISGSTASLIHEIPPRLIGAAPGAFTITVSADTILVWDAVGDLVERAMAKSTGAVTRGGRSTGSVSLARSTGTVTLDRE